MAAFIIVLALAAGAVAGCARREERRDGSVAPARPEAAPAATVSMWRSQFETHRDSWNKLMLQEGDSPIPPERQATFAGIRFYPFAPGWRFVGDLERLVPARVVAVPDTKGKTQAYLEYGRFPFEHEGRVATLLVHRPAEHPEQYFIAFTDSTSGGDTYGGGRYVHLDSLDTHRFVLDFNKAYNPYCAWDPSWICPLPPPENALPFAVTAGMMAPEAE
jgi:uncharacterized protein (DUF1684 family)